MSYEVTTIESICSRVLSGGTPRRSVPEYYRGGCIPWLNTKEIDYNRIYKTENHITPLGLERSSAKWIAPNSVIVAMYGATAGKVAINKIPVTTNQACCNLEIDSRKADYNYVYYYLKWKYPELSNLASGAAQQNLNVGIIKAFPISLPPLEVQKVIGETLSCLDAKIDLNIRINDNLEKQAQAIFKNWFVDFEPFLDAEFVDSSIGPIPDGWIVKALDEVADYVNGLAMQRYRPQDNEEGLPVIKIRELRQGFADESSDRCTAAIEDDYVIDDGDIVFSWSGTLMVDIWTGGRAGLNQHLFKVSSRNYPRWFYYLWTKFHIEYFRHIADSRATTMGHIKRSHLKEAKVLVPDAISLEWMTALMEPLIDMQMTRRMENRVLASLRDVLRPALLSGEIEVPVV